MPITTGTHSRHPHSSPRRARNTVRSAAPGVQMLDSAEGEQRFEKLERSVEDGLRERPPLDRELTRHRGAGGGRRPTPKHACYKAATLVVHLYRILRPTGAAPELAHV